VVVPYASVAARIFGFAISFPYRPKINEITVALACVAPADGVDHTIDEPFQETTSPAVDGAATNPVAPAPVWYAILLAAPPAKFVAVVAVVAEPTDKVLAAT
jgi:hypothetical protein